MKRTGERTTSYHLRSGFPYPLETAKSRIYTASLSVIFPKVTTVSTLQQLSKVKSAPRMKIFDLYLAATALDNGITQICTWNIADFVGIPEIEPVSPEQLLGRVSDGG